MSSRPGRAGSSYKLRGGITVAVPLGCALVILAASAVGAAIATNERPGLPVISLAAPRVVVLKSKRVLHLFDGSRLVRTYAVDLGASPVGTKRRMDDGRTPVGSFRVVTRNADSVYHRFLGINYPDLPTVDWGLAQGLISPGEAATIRNAHAAGECPDWGTALGGGIGIHGHRMGRNWTGGCVVLSDEHVEELFSVLRIGGPVEILP